MASQGGPVRVVQTCVVRLLADTQDAQTLRGTLRCVTDERDYAFGDEGAFLRLLHELIRHALETQSVEGTRSPRSAPHD
jgi:hypothetical protein